LEVTFYPGREPAYETVPGPDSETEWSMVRLFGRIASWQRPAGAQPIEAVRVISRVEGDAVRVTVSTLSGSKALENEQPVGTYLIRETEKISIDDLKRFGIEPFQIKLVRVNPSIPPVPPVILKGVESVVVINSMAKETTLPSYRIILRNQSNKKYRRTWSGCRGWWESSTNFQAARASTDNHSLQWARNIGSPSRRQTERSQRSTDTYPPHHPISKYK
jgi:hypothetical protein